MRVYIFIMLVFVCLLSGCSFIGSLYVMNLTSYDVELELKLKNLNDTAFFDLRYMPNTDVEDSGSTSGAFHNNLNKASYKLLSDGRVSVAIPHKHTMALAVAYNKMPFYFETFRFTNADKSYVLEEEEFNKKLSRLKFYKLLERKDVFKIRNKDLK